jgi:hypothetical protein
MSEATASAFDQAVASDAFASTRANYERFAFLLVRQGHVPGLALSHLDFRVLLFLLGQKPGQYTAHQHTIAKACDSNTTSIRQSLVRLRAAGLVLWELIPPHHALPNGRFTRTNVNRYWVHLGRLGALLDASARLSTMHANSNTSTHPNSGASYGTGSDLNNHLPPSPLVPTPTPPVPPEVEAIKSNDIVEQGSSAEASPEIAPVCEAWNELGLGVCDGRSIRALENRLAQGATVDELKAAVIGAGADDWIRRRAKVPFAVVFATMASLARFAHAGRKILDIKASHARREAQEREKDRVWREEQRDRFASEDPPNAEALRALLPDELRHAIPSPERPMTPEEIARRRALELARMEAWIREQERST